MLGDAKVPAAIPREPDIAAYDHVQVCGQTILVPGPDAIPESRLVGCEEVIERALAAWYWEPHRLPLNFRLVGPPGAGKNSIVYALARELRMELYILQGHECLTAEDVCCSARMAPGGEIEYVASPLMAAMLRGGICFFDEIGKVRSEALAPLASVLDERRALKSQLAGVVVRAADAFRFCAAMNQEESDLALPLFIDERLRPALEVRLPPLTAIRHILAEHFDGESRLWADAFAEVIGSAERAISPREALVAVALAEGLRRRRRGSLNKVDAKALLQEVFDAAAPQREA